MMLLNRYLFITILLFSTLSNYPKDKTIFISPVKIPLLLSANFGELRADHYHSGLDIKTQGVSGKEIIASASGYIYRIGVSPAGFGNALYIRHPSGYSTVYAHLDRFTPEIAEYVKNQQYERKSFAITLFPPSEKFQVKQGELIAYSGNSGSSGGPHLHYEIRKSDSETPVNPLLFEFGTGDNIDPVIEKLAIYPVGNQTTINGKNSVKKINVAGGHGNYYIPAENKIVISGKAGFGIKSFDLLNDSYNKCAVYSIELKVDSVTIFSYTMDRFSFGESRYINSHIDYETYIRDKIYIEKTFVMPNDKLGIYKNVIDRGVYNFNDNLIHRAEIIVKDIHDNKSVLIFNIQSSDSDLLINDDISDKSLKVMPYNRSNRFSAENIQISIPSGALYDSLYFTYKFSNAGADMLSGIHQVHNEYTPLHKAYTLSIKPEKVPSGLESKMLIVQVGNDQRKNALSSKWADGYLSSEVSSFGKFFIGIDTVPPVINASSLVPAANLSGKKDIRIKISDDFSGIKSYEALIDNKWALFEYDPKYSLLVYRFDESRISKGENHKLSLKLIDNKDNISSYDCDFTW